MSNYRKLYLCAALAVQERPAQAGESQRRVHVWIRAEPAKSGHFRFYDLEHGEFYRPKAPS